MNDYNREVMKLYQDALKEPDKFIRMLRIATCLVLVEDRKLLDELVKH